MCHCVCVSNFNFLMSSTSPLAPQRWSMRWRAWTSHLWGTAAVSHHSALWDSGPTSQPVCSDCPALQPCTRKCWVEVREWEAVVLSGEKGGCDWLVERERQMHIQFLSRSHRSTKTMTPNRTKYSEKTLSNLYSKRGKNAKPEYSCGFGR